MSGVNKAIILGNLGRDPEIRTLNSGSRIANLSIATSESWKDKTTGEKKERTEWHRVVIFNDNLVTIAEQYLKKGSKVYIEGQLQTRKWQDQSGVDKYTTEIVLKAFTGTICLLGGGGSSPAASADDYGAATGKTEPRATLTEELDDYIPF